MLHEEEDEHLCLQVEAAVPRVKKKRVFCGIMAAAQQKATTFFFGFLVSCFRTIGNKTIAGYYKQGEQLSVPEKTG